MNINEFEENLNQFATEPAKAMAIVLNMCIKHQAMLEGIINTQAMILDHLKIDDRGFTEIHGDFEKDLNDRVAQLQAEVASNL